MASSTRSPAHLLVAAAAIGSVIALAASVSAASPQGRTLHATKAFHGTKDCSGDPGHAGFFCTFKSSNVKAIKVGSRIFYFQAAGKTSLDADIVIYARRGNVATGHCLLHFSTGRGLCTISDGTGTLTGLHVRVRVSADKNIANLWHWDGTYYFKR
jgi:hypothetical protein